MTVTARHEIALRWIDRLLAIELVGLTFLLGCFLDRDTDIWWHLRAGREMLAGGGIPRTDSYLFSTPGAEWIDLHWGFQVIAAWIFAHAGFAALTIGAAMIAAAAVALALRASTRERSVVAVVWCLLPAVLVMSDRFYPRPEILSLAFLAAILFVLHAAARQPSLLWWLVPIHLLWVNVHGLFILGLVLSGAWLVDRAVRSIVARERHDWRQLSGVAVTMVVACFVNPYTWKGVIFPLTLFRRMSSERAFYGQHIGELISIPDVLLRQGISSVYLRLSLLLFVAAAASFLLRSVRSGLYLFRLLALVAFAGLSVLASRNQPQFALVAGVVLAWNVGDWLATRREPPFMERAVLRVVTSAALVGMMLWVATGRFYAYAAESRLVGLGEQPFWYAHAAAKFAAADTMPRHFLAYHEGQAAVLEFHMRPDQRVFVDPRLEVSPRQALEQYYEIAAAMGRRDQGWSDRLLQLPQPLGVLVDHGTHHVLEAALLTDAAWRCVWFDATAGVYVPATEARIVAEHAVDFVARYFADDRTPAPWEAKSFFAVGRDLLTVNRSAPGDRRLGRMFLLLAAAAAREMPSPRRSRETVPAARMLAGASLGLYGYPDKDTGPAELSPELLLGVARARFHWGRAIEQTPTDFESALALLGVAQALGDPEAMEVAATRVAALRASNVVEFGLQQQARALVGRLTAVRALQPALPLPVDTPTVIRTARDLIAGGRFLRALTFLQRALGTGVTAAPGTTGWQATDLEAVLLLAAGDTNRARALWSAFSNDAEHRTESARRLANVDFVEGRLVEAISTYRTVLASDPRAGLVRYGLAIALLERGDRTGFVDECRLALESGGLPPGPAEFCREIGAVAQPPASEAAQGDLSRGR